MYVHPRICTEMMYWWMRRDLSRHRGSIAIDLGAGSMRHRRYLRAPRYVAVEIDEARLSKGAHRYPDAERHVCRIEDFRYEGGADIVVCMQVMLNHQFVPQATVAAVANAIALTRSRGCLIFTIGYPNRPYEDEVDEIVGAAFQTVRKSPFGQMDVVSPLSLPLGFVCSLRRSGWEPRDPRRRRVYYYCADRNEGQIPLS